MGFIHPVEPEEEVPQGQGKVEDREYLFEDLETDITQIERQAHQQGDKEGNHRDQEIQNYIDSSEEPCFFFQHDGMQEESNRMGCSARKNEPKQRRSMLGFLPRSGIFPSLQPPLPSPLLKGAADDKRPLAEF